MALPKIKSIEKSAISLHGIKGNFSTPNSEFIIKYFSTFANNKNKGQGPHRLLKELKPMRERVEPGRIDDLSTLLQRDLNDSRVANELVPYLLGHKGGLAFFPAILAILIPKNYLTRDESEYPEHHKVGNKSDYTFNDEVLWSLEVGDNHPLGILKIYEESTDIIVLDGQHRANAFRVVTGDFFEDRNAKLYEPFYQQSIIQNLGGGQDHFEADLPVTLVWFEKKNSSSAQIKPDLVSRKLFVDVNNTAKPVSESRTILLNDFEPSSVLTRFFYSETAKSSRFEPGKYSMLHGGFDVDSDLRYSSPHVFSLTTPQIAHYCMDWIFFGTRHHLNMSIYEVKRERQKIDTSQCKSLMPKFGKFLRVSGDDENEKYFDMEASVIENIEDEFSETTGIVFRRLFNEFIFLKIHYKACSNIFQKRNSWGSMTKKEVLDKVFCGGEGLYYAYKNVPNSKTTDQIKDVKSAIDEIELELRKERKNIFENDENAEFELKRINDAYDSFRTKAFQVGFFMAFYHHYNYLNLSAHIDINDSIDIFLKQLSKISASQWVTIFTELRPKIIKGTDPKKWPSYHKILLKIIEDSNQYFDNDDSRKFCPEMRLFKTGLKEKLTKYCDLNEFDIDKNSIDQLDESLRNEWFQELEAKITDLFHRCGLQVYKEIDFNEEGIKILSEILKNEINNVESLEDNIE